MATKKTDSNRLVGAEEVVELYWVGAATEAMPTSIRMAEAAKEELVADFRVWYQEFRNIMQEDERNKPPEDRDLYPPETFIIAALLEDYELRIKEKRAATRRKRRELFQSLAHRQLGREFVYREGVWTLFIAKLLGTNTNEKGVEITFQVLSIDGLTFLPPVPVCEITQGGEFTVGADWDSFWFDELRWSEPYVGWNVFLSEAILSCMTSEAKALANASPEDRFSALNAVLIEEARKMPQPQWKPVAGH
jgi:hypothetical protein